MTSDLKLGVLAWNQYTDWPALREAGMRADQLGYDSLWTWDHLYPIVGSPEGPMFEGWLTLAAWAERTEKATLGLMVGANTFRNPAVVAKMATTLDHISGGRAVLGIGGAWFETEHRGFGIEFGGSPGERLRWLEEAARIMRGMLHGEEPSGDRFYHAHQVRNDPMPLQDRLPLLIGGGGERKTLRIVARYADACNVGGGFDNVKRKDEILRRHCEEVGRDESEIERTVGMGICVIRDDPAEAQRVANQIFEHNGNADPWKNQLVGTPEQVADAMRPFLGIGFRHFIVGFPSPYDAESMERLATEVRPELTKVPVTA
ncbi:MAG TPA: LLM class flavin-dependent oxidoreductase [Candidatus Limnocylindria bacterium]|nr:LLM class flavin-dependent oxidoreductase [Candidatus Limnocylindria bacterium]